MASNKERPKRSNLSIEDRVKILERLDKGETRTNLAREYKISEATIVSIKKSKENLIRKRDILIMCQGTTSKKRCTGIENTDLDQALYKWFLEKKNIGELVTGPMLRKKALEFNKMLNGMNNFKASTGFLDKFKKRYNITLTPHGKNDSNNDTNSTDEDESDNFYLELTSDNDECLSIHEQEWKVLNDQETLLLEQCKSNTNYEKHEKRENKDLCDVHSTNNFTAKSAFEGIDTFMSWYQTQEQCSPQDWQHLWKFWKHALDEIIKNRNKV